MIKALSEFLRKVEGKEKKKKRKRNKEQNKTKQKTKRPYVNELGKNLINIEPMYKVTSVYCLSSTIKCI